MYVTAEFEQVIVCIYQYGFESPLVEMSDPAMATVVSCGIADVKMPHEFGKISFWSLHDHMKVVAHEHISVDTYLIDPNRCF
jgi:hypothetical protein